MKRLFIPCAILLFLFGTSVFSQVSQEWVQRFSGPGIHDDYRSTIVVDDSGNAYVAGRVYDSLTNYDICTIKYSSTGVQLWAAIFAGPGIEDDPNAIALDNSGNVYVTGQSSGEGGSYFDYCTIKYNLSGSQLWVQRFRGPAAGNNQANSIAVDASGNIYVTGSSASSPTTFDYCTLKYDPSGALLWSVRYISPGHNAQAYRLVIDRTGNIFVSGAGDNQIVTIKYNSSGIQQWIDIAPGRVSSLVVDDSSDVYIAGQGTGGYLTMKYNSSNVLQWMETYQHVPGNGNNAVNCLAVDSRHNVYVTGYANTGGSTNYDYATIKYSPSGVQQWIELYNSGGYGYDAAKTVAVDASGNVYVTGSASSLNTLKYDSSGNLLWTASYGDLLALGPQGSIYITGQSYTNGSGADILTVKYSQLTGIQPVSNEIPGKFTLSQNYPNPFNPSTKIRFDIPKQAFTKITVFDILGREVVTLANEELNPGKYEVDFDASSYSSGLYFYKITSGSFTEIKKMVLVK